MELPSSLLYLSVEEKGKEEKKHAPYGFRTVTFVNLAELQCQHPSFVFFKKYNQHESNQIEPKCQTMQHALL